MLISADNEPDGHACMHIWRLPRRKEGYVIYGKKNRRNQPLPDEPLPQGVCPGRLFRGIYRLGEYARSRGADSGGKDTSGGRVL